MDAQTSRDLAAERARGTFPPLELTALLRGGMRAVEARARLLAKLAADPLLGRGRLDDSFLSRGERFKLSLARIQRVHELGLTKDEAFVAARLFREGGALEKAGGFGLHSGMFIPTIELMGTDEQRAHWLPLARSYAILGTYAQTEMAHGTNLAQLETTATFDPRTDEFELHSPTVSSTKWWPGGLGKSTTHAVVMAQLTTPDGERRGQQPFLVQLRDLRTHLPLPGIELGDIGPKMGYDRVDNGYLRLARARVPRAAMLARHARVERDGRFVQASDNPRAAYGTMLFVRVYLVEEASLALQHATTIAARYSAVRRQGGGGGGADALERAVLDYQTQQSRLLPLIAAAYASHFAAAALRAQYDAFRASADVGALPALHATSSALKSHATTTAAAAVETCRLLCGGHGYSMASGLPGLYAEFAPAQTYEGDNVVLLLQTARWMLKQLAAGAAGEAGGGGGGAGEAAGGGAAGEAAGGGGGAAAPSARAGAALDDAGAYLREAGRAPDARSRPCALAPAELAASPAATLGALREAARVLAVRAAAAMHAHVAVARVPYEVAWSERASAELVEAGRAHARYLLAACFDAALADADAARGAGRPALSALGRLRDLHVASACDEGACRVLLESGHLTPAHTRAVRARVLELLPPIRRDAVSLVDAFGLTDLELNSVLGRDDGDVYGPMLEWARRSPLNATQVVDGFEAHVRPIMGHAAL